MDRFLDKLHITQSNTCQLVTSIFFVVGAALNSNIVNVKVFLKSNEAFQLNPGPFMALWFTVHHIKTSIQSKTITTK